jgi:hypothetical protein
MGSDISKVQSHIDLSMRSIQCLQKEQVLLVKSMKTSGATSTNALGSTDGVMVAAPPPMIPSTDSAPQPRGPQVTSIPNSIFIGPQSSESESRHSWIPKMEFPWFDGSDVRVWLDKCSTYFQLYSIPPDFRVMTASLHMVDRALSGSCTQGTEGCWI